jgi:hypothetical protein
MGILHRVTALDRGLDQAADAGYGFGAFSITAGFWLLVSVLSLVMIGGCCVALCKTFYLANRKRVNVAGVTKSSV